MDEHDDAIYLCLETAEDLEDHIDEMRRRLNEEDCIIVHYVRREEKTKIEAKLKQALDFAHTGMRVM